MLPPNDSNGVGNRKAQIRLLLRAVLSEAALFSCWSRLIWVCTVCPSCLKFRTIIVAYVCILLVKVIKTIDLVIDIGFRHILVKSDYPNLIVYSLLYTLSYVLYTGFHSQRNSLCA